MRAHRWMVWGIACIGLLGLAACTTPTNHIAAQQAQPEVRNVIFMLSDGTPPEAWAMARWFKGQSLASDGILTGAVRTYGADSIITDSAPAGTAFATGYKASDKTIGMVPWRTTIEAARSASAPLAPYQPLPSVLEAARATGRATGLVVTANLQHASPAAFSAHLHDRNQYADIAYQQAHQRIDVMLGGGERYLLPQSVHGGARTDAIDLLDRYQRQGYEVVRSRDALLAASGPKLLGVFAADDMVYDLDRASFAPQQPSLADMTRKAIQVLSRSAKGQNKGFFLFVEASKVDWAAHANDPAGVLSELLAYDEAVKVALDFAKADGRTLLISTSDHGTGGMSIGRRDWSNYATTDDDTLIAPLKRAHITGDGVGRLLGDRPTSAHIKATLSQHWGIDDVTEAEIAAIQSAPPDSWMQYLTGPILSQRAGIGWTTNGHTGGDAFLYSYGPQQVSGLWQNTALAHHMAKAMGISLEALRSALYVDLAPLLAELNVNARLDAGAVSGPQMVLTNQSGRQAVLMLDANVMRLGQHAHELQSLIIWTRPNERIHVPQEAIHLLRSHFAP